MKTHNCTAAMDAKPTKKKKTRLAMQDAIVHDFTDLQSFTNSIQKATEDYANNGIVFIRVANKDDCQKMIAEQWTNIICKQGFVERADGPHVWVGGQRTNDLSVIVPMLDQPLSHQNDTEFKNYWPMHSDFGACCDPHSFHMPMVWKQRENPFLYEFAKNAMGRGDLWADLNRCIHQLPGMGSQESLHWDCDPRQAVKSELQTMIQGKLMWSESQFVAVPGSHKLDEIKQYVAFREQDFKKIQGVMPKCNISRDKDELGYWKRQVKYRVPAGCVVFWSNKLVHGHKKTPMRSPIEWGMYIGYLPAHNRLNYHNALNKRMKKLKACKLVCKTQKYRETFDCTTEADTITEADAYGYPQQFHVVQHALQIADATELMDRVRSFVYMTGPMLWPSCDIVHYCPSNYRNSTKNVFNRIAACCTFQQNKLWENPSGVQLGDPTVVTEAAGEACGTQSRQQPFIAYQAAGEAAGEACGTQSRQQPFIAYQTHGIKDHTNFSLPAIVPTFQHTVTRALLSPLGHKLLGVSSEQLDMVIDYVLRKDATDLHCDCLWCIS